MKKKIKIVTKDTPEIHAFEFIGSDDFNLYMWKIPPMDSKPWPRMVDFAHMVLRGHRSIVNQVRYNQASCIFASSGVEKIIKIWSPFPLGEGSLGGLKVVAVHGKFIQSSVIVRHGACFPFRGTPVSGRGNGVCSRTMST